MAACDPEPARRRRTSWPTVRRDGDASWADVVGARAWGQPQAGAHGGHAAVPAETDTQILPSRRAQRRRDGDRDADAGPGENAGAVRSAGAVPASATGATSGPDVPAPLPPRGEVLSEPVRPWWASGATAVQPAVPAATADVSWFGDLGAGAAGTSAFAEPVVEPPVEWPAGPPARWSVEPAPAWSVEPAAEPQVGWSVEPAAEPPVGWSVEPAAEPQVGWSGEPSAEDVAERTVAPSASWSGSARTLQAPPQVEPVASAEPFAAAKSALPAEPAVRSPSWQPSEPRRPFTQPVVLPPIEPAATAPRVPVDPLHGEPRAIALGNGPRAVSAAPLPAAVPTPTPAGAVGTALPAGVVSGGTGERTVIDLRALERRGTVPAPFLSGPAAGAQLGVGTVSAPVLLRAAVASSAGPARRRRPEAAPRAPAVRAATAGPDDDRFPEFPDPGAGGPAAAAGPADQQPLSRRSRSGRTSGRRPAPSDPTPRAGRNLPAAIAVGLLLAGAVVASLAFRKEAFVGLVSAAVVVAVWELSVALGAKRVSVPVPPLAVGAVGMIVSAFVAGPPGLLVAFALSAFGVLLYRIIEGFDGAVRDVAAGVFTAAYVPFLAAFSMLLLAADDGPGRVVVFVLVTVCSDIGGYAAGVVLGRHPMAPTVSPKKSWEGFVGSVVACTVASSVAIVMLLDGPWWAGIAVGAATAVTATLGDLSESLLKRDLGVKDMGNLLPGHGGIMDRLDSLLPTAPVVYVLLTLLVPPG